MKLSDTESGKKWLATIKPSYEDVAKRLLNNLVLVSNQKLHYGIKRLLFGLPRENRKIPFSAIYVPIEPPIKKGRHKKGSNLPNYKKPFFDQNGEPFQLNPQNVGSEGRLLNFIRNTYKDNKHYIIWPSLTDLKEKKVRRIILIDDCIGSGERVAKFFRWFFDNRQLKGLCSRKKIKFFVLSYAKTIQGEKKIKKIKRISDCLSCVELTKGRFFWTNEQYREYEQFCKRNFKKNPKAFYTDNGIGYGDSFSMIAFEHGIPNNVPSILRNLNLNESDFNHVFIGNVPNLDKESYVDLKKWIKSGIFQKQNALIYRFLLFLRECQSRSTTLRMKQANDYLELIRDDFIKLVDKCTEMCLIDECCFLTEYAQKLLKKHLIENKEDVEIDNEFYYY